jgi:superoxide dismutase, Cu-Zn family
MQTPKSVVRVFCIASVVALGCGVDVDSSWDDDVNEAELMALAEQEVVEVSYKIKNGFIAFENPYGDGTANPTATMVGSAGFAHTRREQTYVFLKVKELPPGRTFGAHVHKLSCADNKGGTHYQNVPSPTTPTDPAYANATNEIWLDFTTGGQPEGTVLGDDSDSDSESDVGRAKIKSKAAFRVRTGQAKAIVIHTNATGVGGVAGTKLACVDMPF